MPIGSVDNTFIDKIFETNIKGVIWSCKHASHYLKSGSSIINISSIASKEVRITQFIVHQNLL